MIRVRIEGRAVVTGGTAILLGAEEAPVFAAAPVVDAAKPAGDGVVGAGAEQPFGNWAVGSVAAESRGRVPRVIIAFCIQRGDSTCLYRSSHYCSGHVNSQAPCRSQGR